MKGRKRSHRDPDDVCPLDLEVVEHRQGIGYGEVL